MWILRLNGLNRTSPAMPFFPTLLDTGSIPSQSSRPINAVDGSKPLYPNPCLLSFGVKVKASISFGAKRRPTAKISSSS